MKSLIVFLLVLLALVAGYYFGFAQFINTEGTPVEVTETLTSIKDTTYLIEDKPVTLVDGHAEVVEGEGGPAWTTTTDYFGNEARGDLNGDGEEDVAFLLTQNGGGTGTFVYVVAALKKGNGYEGTNGILLGDRIAPQTTEIRDGIIIVNYADRRPDEPMAVQPSVGVSLRARISDGKLVVYSDVNWKFTTLKEIGGVPRTAVTVVQNGISRPVGEYDGSCFVIENSEWALLQNEESGVICWFAGGGSEIGIFKEGSARVVKEGVVDEGSAEEPGVRGGFKTLFSL